MKEAGARPRDRATEAYFDSRTPDYESASRFCHAAEWVRRRAGAGSCLVEVGCGSGNVLAYLRAETGVRRLAGIDVSPLSLERARERTACEVHLGSILDADLVSRLAARFDFAVLGAVLHHLVGPTRRVSRERARLAIAHAVTLVRPGGYVVVHEPVFYPPWAMGLVFYAKRLTSAVTRRRLEVFDPWNNLGAPVVSFYTNEDLRRMVEADPRAEILDQRSVPAYLPSLQRALFIKRREDTTLIVRRRDAACESSS